MKQFPHNPQNQIPHNPIRVRYMRKLVGAGSFILIIKNTQRHQFDYQHSIKIFLHAL
ncbi:hypothetical protein [Helicobacter pylori]|uniref:hypothetical protein n=1 Tax=Helicobacter pylori TaxID=210 RepID=UPI0013CE2FBD|nr:hypothetical protein [Helicobacter pylori]